MTGYRITISAFLPCSGALADMLAASGRLEDLKVAITAAGLVDVKVGDTFVKGTRTKSGPPTVDLAVRTPEPQAAGEGGGQPAAASAEDLLSLEGTALDRSKRA